MAAGRDHKSFGNQPEINNNEAKESPQIKVKEAS